MSMILKDFGTALNQDMEAVRLKSRKKRVKGANDELYINKGAYHLHKEKEELKTFIKPYSGVDEFLKNFFWDPLKAWVKLGYSIVSMIRAVGEPDFGARIIYGLSLAGRSIAQIYTANLRAICRGLSTLVAYCVGRLSQKKESTPMPNVHQTLLDQSGAGKKEDSSSKATKLKEAIDHSPALFQTLKAKSQYEDPFNYLNDDNAPAIDLSKA